MHPISSVCDPPSRSSAFRDAIAPLLPSLEARALRLSRSHTEAEDLVQETVVRALRFESSFEPGTNLRAWLSQILHSIFISGCRRRTRERSALARFAGDPNLTAQSAPAPVLYLVSNEVDRALRALPGKFLRVVELVDLSDLSYREAADELGIPVGTVMSRLFRARRMLEESLGAERLGISDAA
ncbi:MAG TPA: RNA polymerase sigma factor [Polyangiaceae bacterium]|jgi:RNA polymerase sigma-70 factor (ECF subfamily)|nr:RNA polymerase sigma factor [Polyangiaceae bacterium]